MDRLNSILQSILAISPADRYSATNQLYMDLLHQLILTASNANFTDELASFIQNLIVEPTELAAKNEIFTSEQPIEKAEEIASESVSEDTSESMAPKPAETIDGEP